MKIAIGNDHAGFQLKQELKSLLEELDYNITNFGTDSEESVDYPDCVYPVVKALDNKEADFGILLCGSAQGVAITANKSENIRAAVCWETEIAMLARKHNDANVLCLPARFLTERKANAITLIFLNTAFDGGRHFRRLQKITSTPCE